MIKLLIVSSLTSEPDSGGSEYGTIWIVVLRD
jgi:hypothetical protein